MGAALEEPPGAAAVGRALAKRIRALGRPDVRVGAAAVTGLLHSLRGAPCDAVCTHAVAGGAVVLAVFAGVGREGKAVADAACAVVRRTLVASVCAPRAGGGDGLFPTSLEGAVEDAFVEACLAVDAMPCARGSGATAAVCVVRGRTMVVGSVGDAAVALATRRGRRVDVQALAERHVLGDSAELERVQRFGGLVRKGHVSSRDERAALGVTRSLGNLDFRRAGVSQLPSIATFALKRRDACVVLATQPLWLGDDPFAPEELAEACDMRRFDDPQDAARELIAKAFGSGAPTRDATVMIATLSS